MVLDREGGHICTSQTFKGVVIQVGVGDFNLGWQAFRGDGFDHLVWSPDGSLLAVPAEEGGLWLVPTDGSDPWLEPGTEGWPCWTPLWSPNEDGWPLFFYAPAPDEHLPMLWYLTEPGG